MATSDDDLPALNAELQACLKAGEYLDALDICEEIESLGRMEVGHWLAMGRCLMELRRKADAKRAWLRALEQEPDQAEATEALNRNFPGWRREAARPAAPPPVRAQAPPPSPASRQTAPPAKAERVPEAPLRRREEPPRERPAAPRPAPAPAPAPRTVPVAATPAVRAGVVHGGGDGPVNWSYVLEDVAEAGAERTRR